MKMTWELAEALMGDLACLLISAEGGAKMDENGNFDEGQIARANEYARGKFVELAGEWVDLRGEEWQIETPPDEEETEE